MIVFRLAAQSPLIPPQNVMYGIMLSYLVHKIFIFYINGVLKFKFCIHVTSAECTVENS